MTRTRDSSAAVEDSMLSPKISAVKGKLNELVGGDNVKRASDWRGAHLGLEIRSDAEVSDPSPIVTCGAKIYNLIRSHTLFLLPTS